MSAEQINLTVAQFRADFPAFASETVYPESTLQLYIDRAYCFISGDSTPYYISDGCRLLAIELMTAHLQTLATNIANGNTGGGLVNSSSVGNVSVSLTPPTIKQSFDYWIMQTAYGQQYKALLASKAPAGLYLGGSNQRVFR